eukprot:UN27840
MRAFFLDGPRNHGLYLEYLVGVPNGFLSGVIKKYSMESLIKEMESPMNFKTFFGGVPRNFYEDGIKYCF